MPLPDWVTAGLPYKPEATRYRARVAQEPRRTQYELGDPRARQLVSAVNAPVRVGRILMTAAEVTALWNFIIDELRPSGFDFTMPIWTGSGYQTRTCHLLRIPEPEHINGSMDAYVDLELLVKGFR